MRQSKAVSEQVEHVIGVYVADHDGIYADRIGEGPQLRKDAAATIEQQREAGVSDQVAAVRAAQVRHCRRLAKDQ